MSAPPAPRPTWRRLRIALLAFFCACTLLFFLWSPTGSTTEEADLSAIRAGLRRGDVGSLRVESRALRIEGWFRDAGGGASRERFESAVPTEEILTAIVEDADRWNDAHPERPVTIEVVGRANVYLLVLLQTLPWLLFAALLVWIFMRHSRSFGGASHPFARSRPHLTDGELPEVTFKDVAGIEEAKEEVFELIQFLRNPGRFTRVGGRIPRGVFLVGAPGTGKTLLAKAMAGEAGVPFFSLSGSDFVEMYVGVGASRVRELFREARGHAPCIIFLDEIDAVGRRRGAAPASGSEEREQTLNAILVEMDGFSSDMGVIVVAATNRPDILDPALLRPGRFDREITIDLPDRDGRRRILEVHTRGVPLDEDADLDQIARGTPSFSGAELEALVNEGALLAALSGRSEVTLHDLEEAREKVRFGRARRSLVLEEEDRRITAYHEAGHALLAHLLVEVEPLHKVTIIPRGPALGATLQLPERDRASISRTTARESLMLLYGGRIAEERFLGDLSSGAASDIERATELARRMVCEWGMSERLGPILYRPLEAVLEEPSARAGIPLSEETRREIDTEVRRLLDEACRAAGEVIDAHHDSVEAIATALLARESLSGAQVEELLCRERVAVT